MAAFAARREKSGLTSIPIKASEQGCRLGKVERGSQCAKGRKVTQFHRDPSIERGDDEHRFCSLDTIIRSLYNTCNHVHYLKGSLGWKNNSSLMSPRICVFMISNSRGILGHLSC